MKAAVVRELGPPSVLKIEEVPVPGIEPDEVLVRVRAVGISYHDVVQRNGTMRRFTTLPIILGYEIAGIVEKVGDRVQTLKVGDRVCNKAFRSCGLCRYCRNSMETSCVRRKSVHGGYAEYVALPEEVCVAFPATIPFEIACSLGPSTGVALNAVRDIGMIRLAETVLVTGASGGVGLPSIQLARLSGASVIAVTRSAAKKDFLAEAGAEHVIVAGEAEDFSKSVKEITGGRGVDAVIDTVGSSVFSPSFKSLALGGRYVMIGQLARGEIKINPAFIFFQRAKILGVGSVRRDHLEDAVALVAANKVQPKVARTFPLSEIAEAHALLEAGETVGRIVVTL